MFVTGHRFRTTNDFGYVALDILYTYPEDNGVYMCRAVNKVGEDQIQTPLQCVGKESVITTSQLPDGAKSMGKLNAMEEGMRSDKVTLLLTHAKYTTSM